MADAVSVIIPTRNRPEMVAAAVRSALAEPVCEVIVVVDGAEEVTDAATASTLALIGDPRLQVLELEQSVGGSEARNTGARAARGDWVGFLDDDDLWLPGKIAAQLALAADAESKWPVLSCAVIARGPAGDQVWPRTLYRGGQPMSEYLFCRSGWTYGAGLLQTSTLLVRREMMLELPFTTGLKKHQDWDWLLRVASAPSVSITMSPTPLVVFHIEGQRASVGRKADWEFSYRWALRNKALFTQRALSFFIATECMPQAARSGAGLREELTLVRALFAGGLPPLKTLVLAAAFLLFPQPWRRGMRDAVRNARLALARS